MLSQLKENNRILKERLKCLKKGNSKASSEAKTWLDDTESIDASFRRLKSGITRSRSIGDCRASALAPSSGRSLLCDHAKSIRGEASKRIDNLLLDWKEYKKKAECEIKQRFRVEQNLREMLTRKERQVEKLYDELHSMKLFSEEQKQMIDQLNEELECEARSRRKCAELEDELKDISRCVENLSDEIRLRDEIIRTTEQERDLLCTTNAALEEKNCKLKCKIKECEQDVNATRAELEILDDMVHTMHGRKETLVADSSPCSVKSLTPSSSICNYYTPPKSVNHIFGVPKKTKTRSSTPCLDRKANVTMGSRKKGSRNNQLGYDENEWSLGNKKSALTALRSLQREHAAKCNFLADNIKKLKDESKAKEKKIANLQRSMRSNKPFY